MSIDTETARGGLSQGEGALSLPWRRERRTRVLTAVGASYLTRSLVALLASYPIVASVSASGIGAFEGGDGELFEPGGLYLLEVLVQQRAELAALVAPTVALLVAGSLVAVVPEWMLMRALGAASPATPEPYREPDAQRARGAGPGEALPRLAALSIISWVARALAIVATSGLATTASSYFVSARDERLPAIAASAVVLLALVGWACVSALHDLAAIEITLRRLRLLGALERALATARRHPLRLALRYGAWTLAAGAVLTVGTFAASSLDLSSGGSLAPILALALHQAAILGQLGLRAGWLSSAITLMTPPSSVRGELAERDQADAFL